MALQAWKQGARRLKRETYALYLTARHPDVPWYVKALALCVVAYALSPIDLIPDFIPILGYLDDLILVPLGIALVIRLTPREVFASCRLRAQQELERGALDNWLPARIAMVVIVVIWTLVLAALVFFILNLIQG
jgi:uncharacterized membrane protein YkvA (DUF1232 family)